MKFHITITSIFLGIIALIVVPMVVLGQTTHSVQGYAWANMPNPNDEEKTTNCHPSDMQYDANNVGCGQGLGWITLDGVSLNSDTGVFAGSGNSEFGGAVNFAPTTTNAPEAPLLNARVDASCLKTKNPCAITGWIKFTQAADGWDGWVKMSGQTANGGSYGVQLDAPDNNGLRTFSGYAWGDHVAGWIDFKYASVKIEPPEPNPERKLFYCGNPLATPPTGANYQTPEQVAERVARANAQNDGYMYIAERDDSTCLICPEGTSFDRDRDQCISKNEFSYCNDPKASNYMTQAQVTAEINRLNAENPDITWTAKVDNNICRTTPPPVRGCTDPRAINYNQNATQDDGSCKYETLGCTDPRAKNYNPNANKDDGSCQYDCANPDRNGKCCPEANRVNGLCPSGPLFPGAPIET